MDKLNSENVAKKYNEISVIWDEKDKWHSIVKRKINSFLESSFNIISNHENFKILNAGSAGYSYGLKEDNITHIDIAERKISHLKNAIKGDIQNLPKSLGYFDLIICVGSVINYCDPLLVFREFNKVQKGGYLVVEFENSCSFELLGKSSFNKKATIVNTFYNGTEETIWFFAESYIREVAELNGYKIVDHKRFHLLSPLIYRLFKNENFAAKFSVLDSFASKIPYLRKLSSNTIFLFHK